MTPHTSVNKENNNNKENDKEKDKAARRDNVLYPGTWSSLDRYDWGGNLASQITNSGGQYRCRPASDNKCIVSSVSLLWFLQQMIWCLATTRNKEN